MPSPVFVFKEAAHTAWELITFIGDAGNQPAQ